MIKSGKNRDERVYIVYGDLIIESTHTFSEVYRVLPEIVKQLSAGSASSSVCAETGAPDLRHDYAFNSSTNISDIEEVQPRLKKDSVHPAIYEHRCPPYFQSTFKNERNGCESILNAPSFCHLQSSQKGKFHDDDVPYFISPTANTKQVPHKGSMGASSITLSDAFSVDEKMTPRKGQRRRNLSIIATTPSRYRRPVDSLLISHKHPTPINTSFTWRKQQHENEPPSSDSFGYENLDPQSPSKLTISLKSETPI